MRKIVIIFILFYSFALQAQTVIHPTVDTVWFYISKNDTIVIEPTMVTPRMMVITNATDPNVASELYITDCESDCINHIQANDIKESEHNEDEIGFYYIKKEYEFLTKKQIDEIHNYYTSIVAYRRE